MKKGIVVLILIFTISCQEDYLDTPNYSQKIVVDGWIEQDQPARVLLTLSAPYFDDIDSISLRRLLITRAKVSITDGFNEEVLTLRKNDSYFPPYVYESTYIKGKVGQSYNLKVEYSGRTVSSSTTIPEPIQLDSIWFKISKNDTLGSIMIRFSDKEGEDNYYRILNRKGINSQKYTPVFLPNLDGRLIDGQTVTISVFGEKNGSNVYYELNDTISLKICTVNQSVYNFWQSLQQELINSQNPFASSNSRVKSNIEGGLGVWAGYGTNTYRIICK